MARRKIGLVKQIRFHLVEITGLIDEDNCRGIIE